MIADKSPIATRLLSQVGRQRTRLPTVFHPANVSTAAFEKNPGLPVDSRNKLMAAVFDNQREFWRFYFPGASCTQLCIKLTHLREWS
jgi:hypothetical protein